MSEPLKSFERPSVAVDVVLMTVSDGALQVLVQRHAELGWVLPGVVVRIEESLEAAVGRVLAQKAYLPDLFVEQLYTFGAIDRDPRGRVISVAHYALVASERLAAAHTTSDDLALAIIQDGQVQLAGGLGYDHEDIVRVAVDRLRAKIDYTSVALELLPREFTLRALQDVYETIQGVRLAKPAFRRKLLDRGFLKPTGRLEAGGAHRPAELYVRA